MLGKPISKLILILRYTISILDHLATRFFGERKKLEIILNIREGKREKGIEFSSLGV
jgi:hypothetical protein